MTSASPGRLHGQDSPRRQNWAGKSPQQVLAMYPPGRTPVNRVVDVLIELFNPLHTALEKTVSHKTRYERAHFLRRFFRELHTDAGFKLAPDPRNLGQRHVQAMVKVWQRRKLSPGTIMRGALPRDLSAAIPTVRLASNAKVPSAWEPELVERLLAAVDRSSPKGRRDYAILMLASRLGLRLGDIKRLTLDQLHWTTSTIEIVQNKTGEPLVLPLIEEVGAALIDYLRAGRPPVEHRHLFTNLTPPFSPICQNDRLHRVVAYWRELAGIKFKTPQRQGLHSLRHTLATRLLGAQTPFPVISAVLGHASPATTFIYAKADVETLRIAAIDPEEVFHGHAS